MWVLILSLASPYRSEPVALATASGFTSYNSCAKAGEIYERQHGGEARFARWSCVKQ